MGKWAQAEYERVALAKFKTLFEACNDGLVDHPKSSGAVDLRYRSFVRQLNPHSKEVQACFKTLIQQTHKSAARERAQSGETVVSLLRSQRARRSMAPPRAGDLGRLMGLNSYMVYEDDRLSSSSDDTITVPDQPSSLRRRSAIRAVPPRRAVAAGGTSGNGNPGDDTIIDFGLNVRSVHQDTLPVVPLSALEAGSEASRAASPSRIRRMGSRNFTGRYDQPWSQALNAEAEPFVPRVSSPPGDVTSAVAEMIARRERSRRQRQGAARGSSPPSADSQAWINDFAETAGQWGDIPDDGSSDLGMEDAFQFVDSGMDDSRSILNRAADARGGGGAPTRPYRPIAGPSRRVRGAANNPPDAIGRSIPSFGDLQTLSESDREPLFTPRPDTEWAISDLLMRSRERVGATTGGGSGTRRPRPADFDVDSIDERNLGDLYRELDDTGAGNSDRPASMPPPQRRRINLDDGPRGDTRARSRWTRPLGTTARDQARDTRRDGVVFDVSSSALPPPSAAVDEVSRAGDGDGAGVGDAVEAADTEREGGMITRAVWERMSSSWRLAYPDIHVGGFDGNEDSNERLYDRHQSERDLDADLDENTQWEREREGEAEREAERERERERQRHSQSERQRLMDDDLEMRVEMEMEVEMEREREREMLFGFSAALGGGGAEEDERLGVGSEPRTGEERGRLMSEVLRRRWREREEMERQRERERGERVGEEPEGGDGDERE